MILTLALVFATLLCLGLPIAFVLGITALVMISFYSPSPLGMVPEIMYNSLDTFPLTPNAKIDRRALPAPSSGGVESHKTVQLPQTPNEQLIGEVWKKILKVDQVGVFDNFFDLGGHSLLAMQVVTEIQEKTGCRIEPAYLRFESLGQLAVTLEERLKQN